MKAPLFERVIKSIAPGIAANRERSRLRQEQLANARELLSKRKYDGATKGRRTDGWKRGTTSANSEIRAAGTRLRDSSRDLIRNNSWAKKAQSVVTAHVVGTGITPEVRVVNKKSAKALREAWQAWGETTQCDFYGRHNFAGLQALVMDTVFESGEALIRRHRLPSEDPAVVPLKIQVLEPDFLDTQKNMKTATGFVIDGIEFDTVGRVVGYWLLRNHPGELIVGLSTFHNSFFVPASDIIHVYRMDRPGQMRGVPWSHAVILRLKDLDDAHDAYLMRQKIAACFTAFVYDDAQGDGAQQTKDMLETLEPGAIEILPQGKQVAFANPPGVDGFGEFSDDQLHNIAAGYGITFESLTTKLSGVSFLSGRMGQLDMMKNVSRWQRGMLIPQCCDGVFAWFLDGAALRGIASRGSAWAEWVVPQRDMIDPEKEFKILREKVRAGLPLFDLLRSVGYSDPEDTLRKKAEENALLDELGLILDTDPRRTSSAGNSVPVASDSATNTDNSGDSKP